ncbi:MAG: tetratricopeptide repeat protein [Pirellulaceae bacterium]
MKIVGEVPRPTLREQTLWVGALRRAVQAAVACNRANDAIGLMSESMPPWFRGEHWIQYRQHVAAHFDRLILFEVRLANEAEREGKHSEAEEHFRGALDVFAKSRNLVLLAPEVRWHLAMAALKLQRADVGVARLYIGLLRPIGDPDRIHSPDGTLLDNDHVTRVLSHLRCAIRITLTHPSEEHLALHRELNEELWNCRMVPWCAAHRAIAAVRAGTTRQAWEIRRQATDLDEADAEALTLLGVASYLHQQWPDAAGLFHQAAELRKEKPGVERLYGALTRVNLALAGVFTAETKEEFLRTMASDVEAIESIRCDRGESLDADWVRGAGYLLLNRDREALSAFHTAPVSHIAWRFAQLELEAMIRLGQRDRVADRLAELDEQVPGASSMIGLLSAKEALNRLSFTEAEGALATVGEVERGHEEFEAEINAVRKCFRIELALHKVKTLSAKPALDRPPEHLTASVRAWLARLVAQWHLERGEMQEAEKQLLDPIQWLGPSRDVQRLEAVRLALMGMSEDVAGRIFEQLAIAAAASPVDRLLWGLWLCGTNQHDRAREVLTPLADQLPDCLELRLARAEIELADGGDCERAQRVLNPGGDTPNVAELSHWTTPAHTVVYRPWLRRLPLTTWQHNARVSIHRVADMLHGATLLIRANASDAALDVLQRTVTLLGDERALIDPQLGAVYRQACIEEMNRGELERACELHTTASQYDGGDLEFAVKMAEATRDLEATPPDIVLEVFHDWVAVQPEESVHDTPIGRSVRRFLFIDAATPGSPLELERRREWCQRFAAARPNWDWPKRNLARHASRVGEHEQVLASVASIDAATADDHVLCGHSAWSLERFSTAFDSFSAAADAGLDTPEVRSWRGCARAAVRLGRLRNDGTSIVEDDLAELLPDLQGEGCPSEMQPRIRAWRGSVLLAASRPEEAVEALEAEGDVGDLIEPVRILCGLALVCTGRHEEVFRLWEAEGVEHAVDLTESLRLLAQLHLRGGRDRVPINQRLRELRKRNVSNSFFHLASAHRSLWDADVEEAQNSLERLAGVSPLPVLLAPLQPIIVAEQRLLEARLQMQAGDFAAAEATLGDLELRVLWPNAIRYALAMCAIGSRRVQDAAQILSAIVEADSDHVDARAQLALILVRTDLVEPAEQHAQHALKLSEGHAFSQLALAETQQHRGETKTARDTYRRLIKQRSEVTGTPALASAMMALARMELDADRVDAAEKCLRKAIELRPRWDAARVRLAFLLAAHRHSDPEMTEAAEALEDLLTACHRDARVTVAASLVAHRLHEQERVSDLLQGLIKSPDLEQFPQAIRHRLIRWGLNLHLSLRRFGAAAESFEALSKDDVPVGEELDRCRLLEAIHLLKSVPLTNDELARAMELADTVRHGEPEPGLGTLLVALCRVLLGRQEEPATAELALRLKDAKFETTRQQLLAGLTRHLAGDETAVSGIDALMEAMGREFDLHDSLELLVANQNRQVPVLVGEANAIVAGDRNRERPRLLGEDDLIVVAALDRIHQRCAEDAIKLLGQWHDRNRGDRRTRTIHSKLLAKRAVRALKRKDILETRDLLVRAVDVLKPSGEGDSAHAGEPPTPDAGSGDSAETPDASLMEAGE